MTRAAAALLGSVPVASPETVIAEMADQLAIARDEIATLRAANARLQGELDTAICDRIALAGELA